MVKNNFFIILKDNSLILKINENEEIIEYKLKNIKDYPNIPFYMHFFDIDDISKSILNVINQKLSAINKIQSKLFKPRIFVLIPDDAITNAEKKLIEEYMSITFKSSNVYLGYECIFISPKSVKKYVCISISCRMIVLSYIKDKKIAAQTFIENKDYSIEDLEKYIYDLHDDCRFNKPDVYLNGLSLDKYSDLGKIVNNNEFINNAQIMLVNGKTKTVVLKAT